jgi:adenylate cyclase
MGDGVNIAARLEGVALPGAVCLSDDPYRQARSRLNSEIRDLGEKQLKNTQPSPCASIRSRSANRT